MSVFPGDMSIGWGFGLEPQPEEPSSPTLDRQVFGPLDIILHNIEQEESPLTDPMLAVSELEQRVNELTEQLRSLTLVVNELVERLDTHIEENTFSVEEFERIGKQLEKEGETN